MLVRLSSDQVSVLIPEDKTRDLEALALNFLRGNVVSRKELRSFIGKAMSIATIILTWKPFITQLNAALRGKMSESNAPDGCVWTKQVSQPPKWILAFIRELESLHLRTWVVADYANSGSQVSITWDASPWRFGAVLVVDGTTVEYLADVPHKFETELLDISLGDCASQQVLECLAGLVALRVWKRYWLQRRCTLILRSDNVGANSRWTTWRKFHFAWFGDEEFVPLTRTKLLAVSSMFKAGKYVSFAGYLSRAKEEHTLAGHEWYALLQRTERDCRRSVTRGLSTKPASAPFDFDKVMDKASSPGSINGSGQEPFEPASLICIGTLFMCREIELSGALASEMWVNHNKARLYFMLPASKTDSKAKGTISSLDCLCSITRFCPVHLVSGYQERLFRKFPECDGWHHDCLPLFPKMNGAPFEKAEIVNYMLGDGYTLDIASESLEPGFGLGEADSKSVLTVLKDCLDKLDRILEHKGMSLSCAGHLRAWLIEALDEHLADQPESTLIWAEQLTGELLRGLTVPEIILEASQILPRQSFALFLSWSNRHYNQETIEALIYIIRQQANAATATEILTNRLTKKKGAGVLIGLRSDLADRSNIKWNELEDMKELMIKRNKIWQKMDRAIAGFPFRSSLVVAGDFIARRLVVLNTWGKPATTYRHTNGESQIDYLITRKQSADLEEANPSLWELHRAIKQHWSDSPGKLAMPKQRCVQTEVEALWRNRDSQLAAEDGGENDAEKLQAEHKRDMRKLARQRTREMLLATLELVGEAQQAGNMHAQYQFIRKICPKSFRRRVCLKKEDGGIMSNEEECAALAAYARKLFSDAEFAQPDLLSLPKEWFTQEAWKMALRKLQTHKAVPKFSASVYNWKLRAEQLALTLQQIAMCTICSAQPYVPDLWMRVQLAWLPKPNRAPTSPSQLRSIGCGVAPMIYACWTVKLCKAIDKEMLGMVINFQKSMAALALKGTQAQHVINKHTKQWNGDKCLILRCPENDIKIPVVNNMVYLGVVLSYGQFELATAKHRCAQAGINFAQLKNVMRVNGVLSKAQRLKVYVACVWPSLMYGISAVGWSNLRVLEQVDLLQQQSQSSSLTQVEIQEEERRDPPKPPVGDTQSTQDIPDRSAIISILERTSIKDLAKHSQTLISNEADAKPSAPRKTEAAPKYKSFISPLKAAFQQGKSNAAANNRMSLGSTPELSKDHHGDAIQVRTIASVKQAKANLGTIKQFFQPRPTIPAPQPEQEFIYVPWYCRLRLRNPSSICYLNAGVLALLHAVNALPQYPVELCFLRSVGRTAAERGTEVTLTRMNGLRKLTPSWEFTPEQQDTAEILHLMFANMPDLQVIWDTRKVTEEGIRLCTQGAMPVAIPMPTAGDAVMLQDAIQAWSSMDEAVTALTVHADMICIQLGRYQPHGKRLNIVDLPEQVTLPVFQEDSSVQWQPYYVSGVIIHLGRTPTTGHYRALLRVRASWWLTDDGREALDKTTQAEGGFFDQYWPSVQAAQAAGARQMEEDEDVAKADADRAAKQPRFGEPKGNPGKGSGSWEETEWPEWGNDFSDKWGSDSKESKEAKEIKEGIFSLQKMTLRHEDFGNCIKAELCWVMFLRLDMRASIVPSLYAMQQKWRELKEKHPEQLTAPMRIDLVKAMFREFAARLENLPQQEEQMAILAKLGWLSKDPMAWHYVRWDPDNERLRADTERDPIPHAQVAAVVGSIMQLVAADVVTRFHPSREITKQMGGKNLTMSLQTAIHGDAAASIRQHLRTLSGLGATQLLGMSVRQELRAGKSHSAPDRRMRHKCP
ncbi:unnamed protein product [Symbiodinium sp. CCMP2456]|nr:unnamed protein product [Symbiodinium sp. CCMP2456]